jgi:ABC-type multidrug transport system fused ATPase/permease subunit
MPGRLRNRCVVLAGLLILGVGLEMLGVGLVVPVLAIASDPAWQEQLPKARQLLEFAGVSSPSGFLVASVVSLAAIYTVKTAIMIALASAQLRFSAELQSDVACRIYSDYLHRPWEFHLEHNSSVLIRNIRNEVGALTWTLSGLQTLIADCVIMAGVVAMLFWLEPVLASALTLLIGTFALVFAKLSRSRLARWGIERQRLEEESIRALQEGLGGVREVQVLGRQEYFERRFERCTRRHLDLGALNNLVQQLPRLSMELVALAAMVIATLSILSMGRPIDELVPAIGLFAAAALRLLPGVGRIMASTAMIQYHYPALKVVEAEVLASRVDLAPATTKPARTHALQGVIIEDVWFRYSGAQEFALRGLNLTIPAGAMVGVIGPSGSGKSTFMDLVLGVLKPARGRITAGGRDAGSVKGLVGYVPQNIFLTDATLRSNVAFGLPPEQIDEARVRSAIQAASLNELVAGLPEGLDTVVGERGVRLSGGQRQRIGIARALYSEPELLVLDEATSALDSQTETEVMDAVLGLKGKMTILIVAHRLSTVQRCDFIVQLKAGAVSAVGTYSEVVGAQSA